MELPITSSTHLNSHEFPLGNLHSQVLKNNLSRIFKKVYYILKIWKRVEANPQGQYVSIDNDPENELSSSHQNSPIIDQKALTFMTREKNQEYLSQLGGVDHLASTLATNKNTIGQCTNGLSHQKNMYGSNDFQNPYKKNILIYVMEAFKGIPTIIQGIFAIVSLGFGMKLYGRKQGWYDGVAMFISIFLTVLFSVVINFTYHQVLNQLSHKIGNIQVFRALRDGHWQQISIFEVVVGDVIFLKVGDYIPADGVLLNGAGYSLTVVEESNRVVIERDQNPFLLSGSKVIDGHGRMLVTCVSNNSLFQQVHNQSSPPLSAQVEKLASWIIKGGIVVGSLYLVVLLMFYFTGNTKDKKGNQAFNLREIKAKAVIGAVFKIISAACTVVAAAIPEGLALAVSLTLSSSMKMMSKHRILIRKLCRWENIGSTTVICINKTGILTLGKMSVSELRVGKEKVEKPLSKQDFDVLELFQEAVSVHQSAFMSNSVSVGCPIEKAIFKWGVSDLMIKMDELGKSFEILQVSSFDSEKKQSGVMIRKKKDAVVLLHFKGAAGVIIALCSKYYDRKGKLIRMTEPDRRSFERIIQKMGEESLTCIAFAQKQVNGGGEHVLQLNESGLCLLGIVGLKDPVAPGVLEAVESCENAGVSIKLITGDDISTAEEIAKQCRILNSIGQPSEAVVRGNDFRNYSIEERLEKIDKIQVMASSSPEDRLVMVQCLKQRGHVVAVIDDGTHNTTAVNEADIGISMCTTECAQLNNEGSDIVVLDGNIGSIVTILRWGRYMFNNIQKVMQVQLTIAFVGYIVTFVVASTSGSISTLWANMMVDTLVALALATEQPPEKDDLMKMPPLPKSDRGVINIIWRNIIGQTLYQVTVLLTIQFKGKFIFGVDDGVRNTLLLNCFVLCQVFHKCNARKLENKNIIEGIKKNRWFLGIVGLTITIQVLMVEVLNSFADTEKLTVGQWAACIAIAVCRWPIGWLAKNLFAFLRGCVKS